MAEPMTETGERAVRDARAAMQRSADQVAERFGEGKNTAAREALGVARALRNTADQLERQSQGSIAGYARSAANVVERIGESLERKSPSQMLNDVERICRDHPAAVGVGAIVLGFLGARVLRGARGRSDDGETVSDIREAFASERGVR
jgi:hypothetical protein